MALILGLYLAPLASEGFYEFDYKYLHPYRKAADDTNVFRQISDNDVIYVSKFNLKSKTGQNFALEHFEDNKLVYKINASSIKYNEKDSIYELRNYFKRNIGEIDDNFESITEEGYDIFF